MEVFVKKLIFILGLVVATANFSNANCMAFWKKTPLSEKVKDLRAEISSKIAALAAYIAKINGTLIELPACTFSHTIQNLNIINIRFEYCNTHFQEILVQLSEANFAESARTFKLFLDVMKAGEKSFKTIQDHLNS